MALRFDRRTVLRLLGASSIGGMLPWLSSRSADAGPNDVPLRILFIELGEGARRTTWEPTVASTDPMSTTVETNWELRPLMSALEPYKSRITMFQNLDMVSLRADSTESGNAHETAGTHMVVADDRYAPTLGGGVSIDQLIAQRLNQQTLLTQLRSLEIGVTESSSEYSTVSNQHYYATPGEKLPFIEHIPDMWNHIFPEPLPDDAAEQQRLIAKKTSVYNHVRADYERLIAKLGVHDREKIQRMLQLREELQQSLTLINDRAANRPPEEEILGPWSMLDEGYQKGNLQNRLWATKVPLVGKLAGAALHTDTTRVVTMRIDNPPDYEFGYTAGTAYAGVQTSDAHDLTHKVSGDNPELSDQGARQAIFDMQKLYYDQLAALLAQLDSLPETDGGTMLDHTVVVVHSHIADGSHDVTRLPWMVIGNAQGRLKAGQLIRFPTTHKDDPNQVGVAPNSSNRIYTWRGRPHNDLFTTLTHAMGVPVDDFGRALPESKGVISEMLA